MATKKSKTSPAPSTTANPVASPFVDTAWENVWGLADDTRVEVHKQVGAFIAFTEGALQGVTGYATKLSDRCDEIAREGIVGANRAGRALVSIGRESTSKLLATYRESTTQLVATTRDNARNVADRASATARVMIAPVGDDKKAA